MNIKDERTRDVLMRAAAEFFLRESAGPALITVTRVTVSEGGKNVHIGLSVLPEQYEENVADFAHRKRGDLAQYIKEHTRLGRIPYITITIDYGEKNRQKIDELGRNT
ncbi:MAG: ribosome-binding factor A [Candidatus Paceibacterota bacterium]